jgi:adenylate cyclase
VTHWAVVLLVVLLGVPLLLMTVFTVMFNVIGPRFESRKRADEERFAQHADAAGRLLRYRRFTQRVPANPRCKICYVPFAGIGRLLGSRPSRLNPSFCAACFEGAPLGGYETDIGVLFADARGYTAWAKTKSPTDCADSLNRFYNSASASLMAHDAIIDKFVGDEVMALFVTAMPTLGSSMCDQMLAAAQDLLVTARDACGELPIGVGLNCGTAWIGNVGSPDVRDFTALGDVVNMAARLQGCAEPGQIVLSEAVRQRLTSPPPMTVEHLSVKGAEGPVHAHVVPSARHASAS